MKMAENQLLCGLKRRYGQTLGFIARGDDRTEDLAHLAAVILMFQPAADLAAIKPIRPYCPTRTKHLSAALAILRQEGRPMTARALAKRVLEARGVPLVRRNIKRVECSFYVTLAALEGQGVTLVPGEPKRWAIEP